MVSDTAVEMRVNLYRSGIYVAERQDDGDKK